MSSVILQFSERTLKNDWFMDASRIGSELGIVLTVPRLSGRQQHRANAGPENPDPEVY